MCTLIVLHRCVAGRPLVVAANRDEFFARPAEDMALRSSRTGPILSPLDLEAGGTWVGLSQRGVFAGLTNLRPLTSVTDPGQAKAGVANDRKPNELKSRGGVVMAALESENAQDAIRSLMKLEESAYNPFQLLVADGRDAWLMVYRDRPRIVELEPGPHVVGNVEDERIAAVLGTTEALAQEVPDEGADLGALPGFEGVAELEGFDFAELTRHEEPRAMKVTRIRERVEKLVMEPRQDLFEGLARICREHLNQTHEEPARDRGSEGGKPGNKHANGKGGQSPFESACVHVADRYGTRSSLLLELSENHEANRLWTTNGPPCERPFDNRSSLLSDLGVRLGS